MSFLSSLQTFFSTAEAEVLSVIVKINNGIQYGEAEIAAGFSWLENHAQDISSAVSTIATAVGTLQGAGVSIPPVVMKAVKDANVAVAGLNAMVANQEKGTPQALVDGYVAAKQALAAANSASIVVAKTTPDGAH